MSKMTARLAAALSDRYRIERQLGAGGMATVYLAADLKHDRNVALKVLKPELAAVVGAERFLAEIRTTANLQHPHILPLFDSGEADGFLWYAMPYVEGESLRERIDREKQLPVDEAVGIAAKVLGALEHAHAAGVVHRDIKPANVLISRDGEPLVADFGIALAVQEAGGGRLTETGLSLGTPYYMSPEQATGDREPDARSDVYSLGCVLYEMLTGEPPFQGTTAQAVLGRIITGDVTRPTEVRKSVPANVEAAVLTALEKLPADRFGSAGEFGRAIVNPAYASPRVNRPERGRRGALMARTALPIAAAVAAFFVGVTFPRETDLPARGELLLDLGVQARTAPGVLVGPGGIVAYQADGTRGEAPEGFVRLPTELDSRSLGIEADGGWRSWAFSPDGRFIAGIRQSVGSIERIPVDGGDRIDLSPRPVPNASGGYSTRWDVAFWSDEGLVVAEQGFLRPPRRLLRFREDRLEPELLFSYDDWATNLDGWAPGPDDLIFAEASLDGPFVQDSSRIIAIDLSSGDTAQAVALGSDPHWVGTGHLVYVEPSGRVMALPFDPRAMAAVRPAFPLGVTVGRWDPDSDLIDVHSGNLVFLRSAFGSMGPQALEWWDPASGETERLRLPPSEYGLLRIGPDGRQAVVSSGSWADFQVGVRDLVTGEWTLVPDPQGVPLGQAIWSPSGDALAFFEAGTDGPVLQFLSGDGLGEIRTAEIQGIDGRESHVWRVRAWPTDSLILATAGETGPRDVLELRRGDDGWTARALLSAPWDENLTSVSPDLRWVTVADRPGDRELWLRPLDDMSEGVRLATSPSRLRSFGNAAWTSDGALLYNRTDSIFRVDVSSAGTAPRIGTPVAIASSEDGFGPDAINLASDGRILRTARVDSLALVAPEERNRVTLLTGLAERIRRMDPAFAGGS